MWLPFLLIVFARACAGFVEVSTAEELHNALENATVTGIRVAATELTLERWQVVNVSRVVALYGGAGVVFNFSGVDGSFVRVVKPGLVTIRSLILADLPSGVPSSGAPLHHVNSAGGRIVYEDVVFYSSGAGHPGFLSAPEGSEEYRRKQLPSSRQKSHCIRAWRLDDQETREWALSRCSVVHDMASCYRAGSVMAFDSSGLAAALAQPNVSSIIILQDITIDAAHCSSSHPVVISRPVILQSCTGSVLNLSGLQSCWLVSSGGLLQLQPGLRLIETAAKDSPSRTSSNAISVAAISNAYRLLLLGAVDVSGSGMVTMKDVNVQVSQAVQLRLNQLADKASTTSTAGTFATPQYHYSSQTQLLVQVWHLVAQQSQLQQPTHSSVQNAGVPLQQQHHKHQFITASQKQHMQQLRPGLTMLPASAEDTEQQQRRLLAPPTAAVAGNSTAEPPEFTHVEGHTTAENSHWKAENVPDLTVEYPKSNCFPDYKFVAENIEEFVRLIQDPASTHIELVANIVFTEQLFPPANANDQSKGINVTHKVTIRACTGDPKQPIVVDVNNLQQQIYVYGEMRWQGNLKFINSYPSQRRAGLFPLISILSVEGDGIIFFEDLHIHGNEPCPLFDPNDRFWDRYGESPLSSEFVPRAGNFHRISPYEVLIYNWKFNKTAWVLNSQGTQGVVKAVGSGYWLWEDVLVTWGPPQRGPQGAALTAAIAVPIVAAVALLCGGGIAFWRRRRRTADTAVSTNDTKDANSLHGSATKSVDLTTAYSPTKQSNGVHMEHATSSSIGSHSGSKDVNKSQQSFNTQELIEEARRRMQGAAAGRKEANIVLEGLLGEGTFGKVYKGVWQGTTVAIKTMLFPAAMSGKEKREKMAIMETAISSSLSHPNIVQMYTYVVKPLTGELALQARDRNSKHKSASEESSDPSSLLAAELAESHGWEVRLVLELCDRGSLKDMLNAGGLLEAGGKPDMVAIVATALEVARAMLHLHSENIIHSDLKARNVLLKSAGADERGFVAKVSDFGLSVRMDPTETHVSNVYQNSSGLIRVKSRSGLCKDVIFRLIVHAMTSVIGLRGTLTHMAPEVLMYGKISKASDVYAFGILMWELYTAQQAFKGTPKVLLGHEVTKMGHRPEFPADCPFDYQLLACRCWESDPAIRPTFQEVLAELQRMAAKFSKADSASSPSSAARQSGSWNIALQSGLQPHLHTGGSAGMQTTAPALGLGGLNLAKLHNWEPQTSLLDLNSNASTQGSSTQHATPGTAHVSNVQNGGAHSEMSWGTFSGGGFWLGGELAPSDTPSGLALPLPLPSGEDAAVPGLHPAAAGYMVQHHGGAIAAQQNGTQQQHAAVPTTNRAVQQAEVVGHAAADTQQQLPPAQRRFIADVRCPRDLQLQGFMHQHSHQHALQQHQHALYMHEMVVPIDGEPASIAGNNSVYVDDLLSTMSLSNYSASAVVDVAGGAATESEARIVSEELVSQGSAAHRLINMATIAEEAEGHMHGASAASPKLSDLRD